MSADRSMRLDNKMVDPALFDLFSSDDKTFLRSTLETCKSNGIKAGTLAPIFERSMETSEIASEVGPASGTENGLATTKTCYFKAGQSSAHNSGDSK